MENVSRGTIKIPKWLIVLMALAFLIIPFGSASASTTAPAVANGKPYIMIKGTSYSYLFVFPDGVPSGVKFYNNNGFFLADSPVNHYRYYAMGTSEPTSSTVWNQTQGTGTDNIITSAPGSGSNGTGFVSVWSSNYNIYSDSTFTSFFFSAPPPPPPVWEVEQVTVEQIPEAILLNLHGGLLGLGLTILAVMLGVSLVPRLIHYFNR